jgi:hypothetical protein
MSPPPSKIQIYFNSISKYQLLEPVNRRIALTIDPLTNRHPTNTHPEARPDERPLRMIDGEQPELFVVDSFQ